MRIYDDWSEGTAGTRKLNEILANQKRERREEEKGQRLIGWWINVIAQCTPSFINSLNNDYVLIEEADADLIRLIRQDPKKIDELLDRNCLLIGAEVDERDGLSGDHIMVGPELIDLAVNQFASLQVSMTPIQLATRFAERFEQNVNEVRGSGERK